LNREGQQQRAGVHVIKSLEGLFPLLERSEY
jgi:hypothetical protein